MRPLVDALRELAALRKRMSLVEELISAAEVLAECASPYPDGLDRPRWMVKGAVKAFENLMEEWHRKEYHLSNY